MLLPDKQIEEAASLAEKGQAADDVSPPGSDEEEDDSPHGAAVDLSPEQQASVKSTSVPDLDDQHTYENKAFLTERSASLSGSEQALSATDRTMSNDVSMQCLYHCFLKQPVFWLICNLQAHIS